MKLVFNVFTGNLDYVASSPGDVGIVFPLAPNLGGTGIANAAGSTLTLGAATSITGGGTVALGGFTLTVPASLTAAGLAIQNLFTTQQQITVATATLNGLIIKTSDNGTTKGLFELQLSTAALLASFGIKPATTSAEIKLGGIEPNIIANTADGADNARVVIAAGGAAASSRGGYIACFGNEHPTFPGAFQMVAGNVVGGEVQIFTQGTQWFTFTRTGRFGCGLGAIAPTAKLQVFGEANLVQLLVSGHTTQTNPVGHFYTNDTTGNAVREALRLESRVSTASTGGSTGFGPGLSLYAETATDGTYQQQGRVYTYWVDATNVSRKAILALSAFDTAERVGIEIRANGSTPDIALLGDTWWEGEGFGLPYGSCSSNDTDINWTQAAAVQNTWYDISDADMVDGQLNLVTHDGNGQLTVTKGGRYLINYSLVAESSAANNHLETAISVSGTESGQGISHAEAVTPNAERNFSGTAILDLAANATINLSIRTTDAGTPNLKVEMMDITLVMVGGT